MPNSLSPLTAGPDEASPATTLLHRGMRQLAILRVTSSAITHAPTLDDCAIAIERARELLSEFERAAESYHRLTAGDLLEDAAELCGELPTPQSWQESAIALLLLCLATQVELEIEREQRGQLAPCSALASTVDHLRAAHAALDESGAFPAGAAHSLMSGQVGHWLHVALGTLHGEATRKAYRGEVERTLARRVALPH